MKTNQGYTGFWKNLGCFLSVVVLLTFLSIFLYVIYFVFFNDKEWFNII